MRDKHYPKQQFRISNELYKKLVKLKKEENLSWNLLFKQLYEHRNPTMGNRKEIREHRNSIAESTTKTKENKTE